MSIGQKGKSHPSPRKGHTSGHGVGDVCKKANCGKIHNFSCTKKGSHHTLEAKHSYLLAGLAKRGKPTWNKGLTKETNMSIKKQSEKMKGQKISEESKQKISKKQKICWNNLTDEQQQKKMKKLNSMVTKSPNKSELFIFEIIELLDFKYNGHGPIKIQNQFPELWEKLTSKKRYGFIPDFVNIQYKLLIEFDGGRGHDPKIPGVPKNKPELDILRNQSYITEGWKLLILTPEDLCKGTEHIQNKVQIFIDSNKCEFLEKSIEMILVI